MNLIQMITLNVLLIAIIAAEIWVALDNWIDQKFNKINKNKFVL